MSQKMLLATIGCGLMILGGIVKLVLLDWQVGLLLVAFALTLWNNTRMREQLRSVSSGPGQR